MDNEAKQIKQILVVAFLFFFACFSAIRMRALFRCAWQQSNDGLPVDPLGSSLGVLTPIFGFPLNLLQGKTGDAQGGLTDWMRFSIILNGLFLGLVAASLLIGVILLFAKLNYKRAQSQ